jgi:hypothetical protein
MSEETLEAHENLVISQLLLDADGVVIGAASTNLLMEGYAEVESEIFDAAKARIGRVKLIDGELVDYEPPAPPAAPLRVYKAPMFRKMTDAEYEAYLQIRAAFPPRLQAIFDAAEYLSSDDEFWPDLVAAAEQAYGAERAAELLASSA